MIVQLFKKDRLVLMLDGVKDYELGKHHSTFVSNEGIVETKISMYDYITVQLEADDVEEETTLHREKKIGFFHDESPDEPNDEEDDEEYEDYDNWIGGEI